MIRVIIVDDEPEAREGLVSLLSEEERLEVVAVCKNGLEAIEKIDLHKPDLLFLDIQMPEINGFDVLNNIGHSVPFIIFVTAYDEYALKAFEVHVQDYLLKPFSDQRFRDCLDRAKSFFEKPGLINENLMTDLLRKYTEDEIKKSKIGEFIIKKNQSRSRIVIKSSGKIVFLVLDDIELIEAYENYVKVHLENKVHLVRESMKSMEVKLARTPLVRVHKSFIVNMNHASELSHKLKGDYELKLLSGRLVNVSRNYTGNLKPFMT